MGYTEQVTYGELPMRVGRPDDWDGITRLLDGVFHNTFDAEAAEIEHSLAEFERAVVVTDGEQVVAHGVALTRDLTVPGNVIPAGHVTWVGVAATHRRRRLLTRMMHRQLRDIYNAHREPVAVLWASEARIYPRFGYGLATQRLSMEINTREAAIAGAATARDGRLHAAEPPALLAELTKVYEQLRPDRPGWSSRDERRWRYHLADTPARRDGGTALRAVVHETESGADGYAVWRTKSDWVADSPRGEVRVTEVAATNPAAYASLWEFLLGIDLTRTTRYGFGAVDEPLLHLVHDPRALAPRLVDALWLRVVDVGAALSARRYAAGVDLVLDVTDPILAGNTGRWRLVGDGSTASCTRTDAPADLSCAVTDLGAAYLGGPSWATLAAAGRVRELRSGALAAATAAFGWHRPPNAIETF
jgi:predicted acetyltransferase